MKLHELISAPRIAESKRTSGLFILKISVRSKLSSEKPRKISRSARLSTDFAHQPKVLLYSFLRFFGITAELIAGLSFIS